MYEEIGRSDMLGCVVPRFESRNPRLAGTTSLVVVKRVGTPFRTKAVIPRLWNSSFLALSQCARTWLDLIWVEKSNANRAVGILDPKRTRQISRWFSTTLICSKRILDRETAWSSVCKVVIQLCAASPSPGQTDTDRLFIGPDNAQPDGHLRLPITPPA